MEVVKDILAATIRTALVLGAVGVGVYVGLRLYDAYPGTSES